jgi:hypothetical protein
MGNKSLTPTPSAAHGKSTANLFYPKIRHSGECRNPDFTI